MIFIFFFFKPQEKHFGHFKALKVFSPTIRLFSSGLSKLLTLTNVVEKIQMVADAALWYNHTDDTDGSEKAPVRGAALTANNRIGCAI